jgi:OPA family glycerol-3-phosphate transporter-like MFS transporter/OPA family sugar phosphate sensor protein UhpC-like MFS transporter
MWIISTANLLVYVLRETQSKWGPTFLQETKHMTVVKSGWLGTGSELAGAVSALVAGLIADRFFGGKAGRVCCIAMLLMAGVVYAFWKTPETKPHTATALYMTMGFLLYVPQMLIAAMAMNLGTKRAAAAAVGLTGLLGYMGTAAAGMGIGKLVDVAGWDAAFVVLIGCALGTLVLMAFTWNLGAHPHAESMTPTSESLFEPAPAK